MNAFFSWFKGLFADPKSTVAGLGALAGAATLSYGMYTGAVPVDAHTIATAGGLASAGVAGLVAKDAAGQKVAAAAKDLTDTAAQVAPVALSVVDQYKALETEAKAAQTKVDTFQVIAATLAAALPPAAPPVPAEPAPAEAETAN